MQRRRVSSPNRVLAAALSAMPAAAKAEAPNEGTALLATGADGAPDGSPVDPAADRRGTPPPLPSVAFGVTLFPHQTLEQVSSGRRLGEVQVVSQGAGVSIPLRFNDDRTRLELSAAWRRLQFDYEGFSHPLSSAQSVALTAFMAQQLTEAWGVLFVASPSYADDFHGDASLDALKLSLVAAGTYRFSPELEVGLGVAMQNVFGEPLPLPVASVDWTIHDRLWLESILPLSVDLTWLPIDLLGLRASLRADGNSYHGDPEVYGVGDPQLNYSAVIASAGARLFFTGWLHLTVHGGYTLYRRFQFSDGRDAVEGAEYRLENGPVFGVELGFGAGK